MDKRR